MSADPTLILDQVKKSKAPNKRRQQDELVLNTWLTTEAIVVLQGFTKQFLEYFNSELTKPAGTDRSLLSLRR